MIKNFAHKIGAEVVSLQGDNDDGGTDGVIQRPGREAKCVEARRKGYPNHRGKVCDFPGGWNNYRLVTDGGIFLNELTIQHHKDENEDFIFLVEIKGFPPRACYINKERTAELLQQPHRIMGSTNSKSDQSVKTVPLNWFKKY